MNERIKKMIEYAGFYQPQGLPAHWDDQDYIVSLEQLEKLFKLIHQVAITSILITDVVMEETGQVPTSEDYIRAIHRDFGVEE